MDLAETISSKRSVVSYDDISPPQPPTHAVTPESATTSCKPSQTAKKRKRNKSKHGSQKRAVKHWDEPAKPDDSVVYGDDEYDEETREWEESRELSHEEIWDDSALIEAWNAAAEEYEAYHGPGKNWKKEPVHKSPLWYNIPPPPQKRKGDGEASVADATADGPVEMDSRPINFDTFVPTHDPSLAAPSVPHPLPIPGLEFNSVKGSGLPGPKATRDEAFMRALGAMFWTGYWSAVYYGQSGDHSTSAQDTGAHDAVPYDEEHLGDGDDVDGDGDDDNEDFVPTQR